MCWKQTQTSDNLHITLSLCSSSVFAHLTVKRNCLQPKACVLFAGWALWKTKGREGTALQAALTPRILQCCGRTVPTAALPGHLRCFARTWQVLFGLSHKPSHVTNDFYQVLNIFSPHWSQASQLVPNFTDKELKILLFYFFSFNSMKKMLNVQNTFCFTTP